MRIIWHANYWFIDWYEPLLTYWKKCQPKLKNIYHTWTSYRKICIATSIHQCRCLRKKHIQNYFLKIQWNIRFVSSIYLTNQLQEYRLNHVILSISVRKGGKITTTDLICWCFQLECFFKIFSYKFRHLPHHVESN